VKKVTQKRGKLQVHEIKSISRRVHEEYDLGRRKKEKAQEKGGQEGKGYRAGKFFDL